MLKECKFYQNRLYREVFHVTLLAIQCAESKGNKEQKGRGSHSGYFSNT